MSIKKIIDEMMNILYSLSLATFGAAEGAMLALCGMFAPESFRRQMRFENFLLMKVFMSAVGSSMLVQSLMSVYCPERWHACRSYRFVNNGLRNVLGGTMLLGAGMAIAGSGPTILPTQLAMGVPGAWLIFGGALAGGVVYSVAERVLGLKEVCLKQEGDKVLLEEFAGGHYAHYAVPVGIALLAFAAGLEAVAPHAADAAALGLPLSHAMIPVLTGAVIGLNQIPIRLISNDGQGGSRAIMNIVGTCTGGCLSKRFAMTSLSKAWQFVYVYGGTTLGALAALYFCKQQDPTFVAPKAFEPFQSVIGAAFMVIGARIAGGCTCGHGISGFSELAVQSMVGAAGIFGGGIAAAAILQLPTSTI